MDEHTFHILEFDKILKIATSFAITTAGKTVIQKSRPLEKIEDIREQIDLVSECRSLITERKFPDIEHFDDLSPLFEKLRPLNAVLEPFELRSFLQLFSSAINLKTLSKNHLYPILSTIVSQLTTHPDLKKAIDLSIDGDGNITDGASPELSYIRKGIKSIKGRIRKILEDMLQQKDLTPYLQDFFIAERNGRWVIPVKRDSKKSIPGIVHDISNSGETVYIEPYAIQQHGNELESMRAEEKLEIYRILKRLSTLLQQHLQEIEEDYHLIARIDALRAIASFSEQMRMSPPEINEDGYIKILKGRHPLLWKAMAKETDGKEIVPLDTELGREHTCMVVTGSNAGGKTVALKTIGVISLMALSGMHVPSESGTTIPFFRRILADIGDEQSIEQHQSTFSAHITRISEIIHQGNSRSLVIIDELGTGTDPEQGGALSCAILKRLKQQGALTVVSTHLGMLKAFAYSEPGMINSAMEMEVIIKNGVTIYKPTYKLIMGEPGTSHAFEIAESLGLQKDIINEARHFITAKADAIEFLISELKQKIRELNERLNEYQKLKQEVTHLYVSLKDEHMRFKSNKQEILAQALKEAEDVVRNTRREAKDIINKLKQASLLEGKEIIKDLNKKLEKLKATRKPYLHENAQAIKEVKEGQRVFINSLKMHGIVCSVNRKTGRCRVLVEGKEIMISLDEFSEFTAEHESPMTSISLERFKTRSKIQPIDLPSELNVIGQRVDPALSLIERYLNDAVLAGIKQIKIIHGIGTRTLSHAIHEYLKEHPLVETLRKGNEDEGGEAVTVVFL